MKNRYNWTAYSIFLFVNFLIILLYPEEFSIMEKDRTANIISSSIILIITGGFLIYKFKLWLKKDK